jgi:uncharacterized protein YdaU (DUF1376 family)
VPKIDVWMPWYIADYLADTSHLTTQQHGAYLLLLAHQWRTLAVPNDMRSLIQITKMTPFFADASSMAQGEREHLASILQESGAMDHKQLGKWIIALLQEFFEQGPDGQWRSPRLERERIAWTERKAGNVKRARAGAAGRWKDHVKVERVRTKKAITPPTGAPGDDSANASSIPQGMLASSPSPSPGKNKGKYQRDFVSGSSRSAAPAIGAVPTTRKPARSAAAAPPPPPPSTPTPKRGPQGPHKRSGAGNGHSSPTKRASATEKRGATVVEKTVQPQKPPRAVDSRFGPFRDEVFEYWAAVHKKEIAAGLVQKSPPWGPRERVEMGVLLDASPDLDLRMFKRSLVNRAGSDDIVHPTPPYKWLKDLAKYSRGPLDRFDKPIKR